MERAITEEEIIRAIMDSARARDDNPLGAVSVKELRTSTGRSRQWLLEKMTKLFDEGILGVTFIRKKRIDGICALIPAYYILKRDH